MSTEIIKTWTTEKGTVVTVTGKLITEKKVNLDGDISTIKTCEKNIKITIEGIGDFGDYPNTLSEAVKAKYPGYTHYLTNHCGSKGNLLVTPEQIEIIDSVRAELETTPEWIAHELEIQNGCQKNTEYEKQEKRNGLCPKCGTYCDGDCEANK